MLQLAIKAHELAIASSLYVVAQQCLHGTLLDFGNGMPFGLLGAEKELKGPSYIMSKAYFAAVRYTGSLWDSENTLEDLRRKRHLIVIVIYLFAACVITSLAGPASGVLMIPRVDWFFDTSYNYTTDGPTNYPYLLISSSDILSSYVDPGLSYWHNVEWRRTLGLSIPTSKTSHVFDDDLGLVYTNISTTLGRPLNGKWAGGTDGTTVMANDILQPFKFILEINDAVCPLLPCSRITLTFPQPEDGTTHKFRTSHLKSLERWSGRRYVTAGSVVVAQARCRQRQKESCPPPSRGKLASHWCYTSDSERDPGGTPRVSPNLILLTERYESWNNTQSIAIDRVYLTEGAMSQRYSQFTTSIEVVFDRGIIPTDSLPEGLLEPDGYLIEPERYLNIQTGSPTVTVCSISSSIIAAELATDESQLIFRYADYEKNPKQILYFYKDWLKDFRTYLPDTLNRQGEPIVNATHPTEDPVLKLFADNILLTYLTAKLSEVSEIEDASSHEILVAGAFAYIMAQLKPSSSQYSNETTANIPAEARQEEPRSYPATVKREISVFNLGYGFRLSTRTGMLGITVLIAHAVIVVLGSLWQLCWERKIILGWHSIPEYVALALGSNLPNELDNTCSGISNLKTLQTVIKVGETTVEHLEIGIIDRELDMRSVSDRFGDKFGSRDVGGTLKEKLE